MPALSHFPYLVDGLPRLGETKPLLLFLHGKGERGHDPQAVRAHGPPRLFPRFGLDRFIVLSPQCPPDLLWDGERLEAFLEAFCARHRVDPARIYLTGLSLGGLGGYELLSRCAERFAAAALVCGRFPSEPTVRRIVSSKLPIWLIHSAADSVVPASCSDTLFDMLRAKDAPATYTRYAKESHVETWQVAYGSPMLFDWLLTHRR